MLNGTMSATQQAGLKADWWTVAAGSVGGRNFMRRATRVRQEEQHAKAVRSAVVVFFFIVLLAMALMVGGRAIIDPLLGDVMDGGDGGRVGHIVLTMPDGTFCRHIDFDNSTGSLSEAGIEPCDPDLSRLRGRTGRGFAWGTR